MGNLRKLKELNLYHNLLEDLPVSMKDLDHVEIVDLDYNPLTSIPALIRDEGWLSVKEFLTSDLLTRRKIKFRDHTQTVGQGVMGKDVPKIVELQIKMAEKKRLKEKMARGRRFNFKSFEEKKAKEVLSIQVRTPKINESTWLLFDGESAGKFKAKARKVRQTEVNRAIFGEIADELVDVIHENDSEEGDRSNLSGSEEDEETLGVSMDTEMDQLALEIEREKKMAKNNTAFNSVMGSFGAKKRTSGRGRMSGRASGILRGGRKSPGANSLRTTNTASPTDSKASAITTKSAGRKASRRVKI